MKHALNLILVGAGGVTSYLLPPLIRSFFTSGTLIDGDTLEERNIDRQLFSDDFIGQNKAFSLLTTNGIFPQNGVETWKALEQYLDQSTIDFLTEDQKQQADIIICAVDNHPARRHTIQMAEQLHKPVLVIANELSTSQVLFQHPLLPETRILDRYAEIETDDTGSPINCTGKAIETIPQLAMANNMGAAIGLMLLYRWQPYLRIDDPSKIPTFLPLELQTTMSGQVEATTIKDLQQ